MNPSLKYLALLIVRSKIENVPRDIESEKSRKDTATSGILAGLNNWSISKSQKGVYFT